MRRWINRAVIVGIAGIALFSIWYLKFAGHHMPLQYGSVRDGFWGVTFSKKYAEELDLNWRETYLAILDELNVKHVRLPVYWDHIEAERGFFTYEDYDWMIDEGEKRGVKFILAVGRRLPRWPECHQPAWTDSLSPEALQNQQVEMVRRTIEHFKPNTAIRYWQLENEFFFRWFGICPAPDPELLKREIETLRALDSRPLVLTDSGELNSWVQAAERADILGITIYRVVWSNYFGYFRWFWPASIYRIKAGWAGKALEKSIVAELQAEPWPARFKKITEIDRAESLKSFSVKQFETNSEIARRTGFAQAYFWGAEWWYWLKLKGDGSIWLTAKRIFSYGDNT